MKSNRNLQRAAGVQHAAVHRREFTSMLAVLAVLLAVMATCAATLKFDLVASQSARHFVFLALVCAALALASGAVLTWLGFDGLMRARRSVVETKICAATKAAICRAQQFKKLVGREGGRFERLFALLHLLSITVAWLLAASASGLAHACLSPRLLSQRPIVRPHARAE
jgi:hypothetical protein